MKFRNTSYLVAASLALTLTPAVFAQEGPTPTQMLVLLDSKADTVPQPQDLKLQLNGKSTVISSFHPVAPSGIEIALLIDDGLRRSLSLQLGDIRAFFNSLPAGVEVFVGYMQNGRVAPVQEFTTDHAAAAESLRIPFGSAGMSASPYFCLSDFVHKWPGTQGGPSSGKARIVMMLTNGVDPYNGSTRLSNQDSPYVQTAIDDANRAGVAVYSIYFGDAGFGRPSASFSGQSYLNQVAGSTGAQTFYEGQGSPVSLQPYFKQFLHAISETYVASFTAIANHKDRDLVQVKLTSDVPRLKLHHPDAVRPGNMESTQP